MSTGLGLLLYFLACVIVIGLWIRRVLRRMDQEMVEEFIDKFPGKCMICSNFRYGLTHGYISPERSVDRHYCIERNEWFGNDSI
jgi:hypothetical protein